MEQEYIVRRLTPLECCRLQGFPDGWGEIEPKDDFTDEEYRFWLDVRNTYAEINGKQTKEYTKEQMLKWYNGLHTDAAEYKMWGNGISLPTALYVMQGISDELNKSGKWIAKDDEIFAPEYYCNQCGNRAEVDLYGEWILSDYCPHCGARMEVSE